MSCLIAKNLWLVLLLVGPSIKLIIWALNEQAKFMSEWRCIEKNTEARCVSQRDGDTGEDARVGRV